MATELAQAYVQIIPSAKGIKGQLTQQIAAEGAPTGESFGGKMVSSLKKVLAAAAIGKAIASSIQEGAALEQSLGGIETLFKGNADKVIANANEAYRTAGMSANQYMELTTSFAASLLQSVAGDTAQAADIADMAMTDMSDNANKMGSNMEDIKNAYQGFAKQNYTMLDNLKLGYGGTQAEMQRLLDDAQKLTGVKYDMANLSDVYEAIHVIQGELGITGTTAKEAAETLSGSFASMKAVFKDVLGNLALGLDIGPSVKALAETSVTFVVNNLLPAIGNIITALPMAIVTFIQALIPQLATAFSGLVTAVEMQGPGMIQSGATMVSNFITGFLQNLPMFIESAGSLVTTFASSIIARVPELLSAGSTIVLTLVNGLITNLPQIVVAALGAVTRFITTIGQNLPQILQSGIEIIGKLAAGLIRAIPSLVGQIPAIINAVRTAFTSVDWGGIGRNIISGIANGLRNAAGQLWNAVKGVLGNFKDRVLEFFGIHSPSTWGVWVGKMIDTGIANGIVGNVNLVSVAAQELKNITASPFEVSDLSYRVNAEGQADNQYIADRLDVLISLMRIIAKGKEISLNMNNREVARALRDLGVVFV